MYQCARVQVYSLVYQVNLKMCQFENLKMAAAIVA